MTAQRELGIDIPEAAIEAYRSVKDQVNLQSIMDRERITRHDVKARIEEFCDLAGHQHIHKGMTSRDLTENVEQLQVFRSLLEIRNKTIATLASLKKRAQQWARPFYHRSNPQRCRSANHFWQTPSHVWTRTSGLARFAFGSG